MRAVADLSTNLTCADACICISCPPSSVTSLVKEAMTDFHWETMRGWRLVRLPGVSEWELIEKLSPTTTDVDNIYVATGTLCHLCLLDGVHLRALGLMSFVVRDLTLSCLIKSSNAFPRRRCPPSAP